MKSVNKLLVRYGSRVELVHNGITEKTKAIIEPLYYNRNSFYNTSRFPAGECGDGRYMMICSPSVELPSGHCAVKDGEDVYLVRSHGRFKAADKEMYGWAVLTACTVTAEDDYD